MLYVRSYVYACGHVHIWQKHKKEFKLDLTDSP